MKKIGIVFCVVLFFFLLVNFTYAQQNNIFYFDKNVKEYRNSILPDIVPTNMISQPDRLVLEWNEGKIPVQMEYLIGRHSNYCGYFKRNISPQLRMYISLIEVAVRELCTGREPKRNLIEVKLNDPQISKLRACSYDYNNLSFHESEFVNLDLNNIHYVIFSIDWGKTIAYEGYWIIGNVYIKVFSHDLNVTKKYGQIAIDKIMSLMTTQTKRTTNEQREVYKEQPKQENIPVKATVMPSALGEEQSSTAYLPASKELPARITAETKPNTKVTFQILKSDGTAYLRVKGQKADTVQVVSDSKGIAKALFYYNGGKVSSPKKYEIKVTTGEERDIVTVYVGLGLTFSRISAVQGAYGEKHPFVLSVKSAFFPNLPLAVYLSNASEKVWHGFNVGVRLRPEWVNKPANLPPDKVFTGITKITATPVGATSDNVLTVISYSMLDETVYAHTKYAYPSIKMQSDGVHSYRILGELVLTDRNGKDYGRLDEELIQKDVLTIITREQPESALTSLLCVFEATTPNQLVMLETIKTIPVFLLSPVVGEVVGGTIDWLTTITGTLCKINRGEDYEKIFLDLAQFLGGQYLDNLYKPEVFNKMTERMQAAFLVAYGNYKGWDVYKKQREYEELRQRERAR